MFSCCFGEIITTDQNLLGASKIDPIHHEFYNCMARVVRGWGWGLSGLGVGKCLGLGLGIVRGWSLG